MTALTQKKAGEFGYVDFASASQKGFRNNVVRVDEIPDLIARYRAFECYATYMLYTEELSNYLQSHGSVAGYDGAAYAHYLPLDIDSKELEKAAQATGNMLNYLRTLGFDEESALVYFSGSKGYHIMLSSAVFGEVKPEKRLNQIFAELRKEFAYKAGIEEYVDMQIKDKLRLLRLPNTINKKSGLYKVQLSWEQALKMSQEEIREYAKRPGKLWGTDRSGLIPSKDEEITPDKRAMELYKRAEKRISEKGAEGAAHEIPAISPYLQIQIKRDSGSEKGRDMAGVMEAICDARKAMFRGVEVGERNNACVRLTSALRIAGAGEKEALAVMLDWNKNKAGLAEREVIATIRSVYSRALPYDYGCTDPLIAKYCPYREDRLRCRHYRMYKALSLLAEME